MYPLLAENVIQTNQFDSDFLGKLIQIVVVLSSLGLGSLVTYFIGRRNPSPDSEFTNHKTRIEALEGGQRLLFKKMDGLSETLADLKVRQATNAANIEDIKATVHHTNNQLETINKHLLAM